ncbi:PEP-CTERM sorting domain-containing protein [Cerasicoccus frondis]|uniref:PEP-CTERM sorting domain-containing protein n=1 Tax=Cerasicoccus frondis TaxID=490090 RepID=UPI002852763C|nr:PEP-CTERM sorting domain-containing protein [Cerasicoccus frondis]
MNKLLLIGLTSCCAYSLSAVTIVSSVSDLTFDFSGGAAEVSSGADTISISTSKNSFATASLPDTYQLGLNETMSITFDLQLDNVPTNTASTFNINFANSDGDFYQARVNPLDTDTNGDLTFGEKVGGSSDTNLGKYQLLNSMGITAHQMTLLIERTDVDEMSITYSSPTLSTPRTVTNDLTTINSIFDEIQFNFGGDAWGEDFDGSPMIATISNLTIDTTGSVIPEPSTYAMVLGASVLTLGIMRRRK